MSRFAVAPHADGNARAFHLAEYGFGEMAGFRRPRIGAEKTAADAEIENEARRAAEICVEDRGCRGGIVHEPTLDLFALWHRRQAARFAKNVKREARVNLREALEGIPGGLLTDGDIGVVGLKRLAVGGIGDAHGQPHGDQRVENRQLGLLQCESPVISRHNGGCRAEHVLLSQDGVRSGDGRLSHSQPVVHVAKIDHADHFSRLRPRSADEYVVIVRVAIDDAALKMRKDG